MDQTDTKHALDALNMLNSMASRDCDHFGDSKCTPEEPQCDTCQARAAYTILEQMLTPCPPPLHANRLKNPAERIYWEQWLKLNRREHGINDGFTTLEHILDPNVGNRTGPLSTAPPPPPVSSRDAEVAGAIFQWLGTNCGLCFMRECERLIDKERAARAEWDGGIMASPLDDPPGDVETLLAQQLADEFVPASRKQIQRFFIRRVLRAFRYLTTRHIKVLDIERV